MLDQSSDVSRQTAPTRRTGAASDGKLWTTRAALDLPVRAFPHVARPDAAAVGLGEVEVGRGVRLGPSMTLPTSGDRDETTSQAAR